MSWASKKHTRRLLLMKDSNSTTRQYLPHNLSADEKEGWGKYERYLELADSFLTERHRREEPVAKTG
jgi:hypothetical protein